MAAAEDATEKVAENDVTINAVAAEDATIEEADLETEATDAKAKVARNRDVLILVILQALDQDALDDKL